MAQVLLLPGALTGFGGLSDQSSRRHSCATGPPISGGSILGEGKREVPRLVSGRFAALGSGASRIGVPRSKKAASPLNPTVGLCLRPYDVPRGGGVFL